MNTDNIIQANKDRTTDWNEEGRTCTMCDEFKPWSEFTPRKEVPSGHTSSCKQCRNARYANTNRASRYQREYDITLEEYEALLEKQNGVCGICKKPQSTFLCVDHDHTTGEVRGLLCTPCNRGLGLLGDTLNSIENAYDYLK
jgi:hypothetical protein